MLSRSSIRLAPKPLQCLGTRSFFDYLEVANQVDAGKSLKQQQLEREKAKDQDVSSFSWDFMKWYEKHSHESLPVIQSLRSAFQRYEQYSSGQALSSSKQSVDFSSYQDKVSDPTFVDELEIQCNVDLSTLKSIKNMKTLGNWKQDSITSFKKESENHGDLLFPPMTSAEKTEWSQTVEKAEEFDIKKQQILEEMQKDFEQIDAERMIYGHETQAMKFSEHPQFAENIEDMCAARQSFQDHVMFPWLNENLKQERLAQIQDENRRKLFLERFETASKIVNGYDTGLHGSGGGH